VRRPPAGVGDDWLTDEAGVPGLHRRPFVQLREVGEDHVAGVDVGKVADADLLLVARVVVCAERGWPGVSDRDRDCCRI
jgi:hypothetical protein